MIKKLKKHLLKSFDYELESYALYKINKKRNPIIIIFHLLFIVATILFILEVFFDIENFITLALYIYLFFLFELVPIGWVKSKMKYAIIVTPRFLIQWNGGKNFTVMNYNNITGFKLNDDGISIKEHRHEIILSTFLYKEQVEPIVDILEAYGKTFDKTKVHLIRPISITIDNNVITIIDEDDLGEPNSDLFNEYVDQYPSLTPGYLNQLTFRNSIISNTLVKDENLIINIASLTVREDHPENTTFGQLNAKDCIVIFEHFNVTYTDVKGYDEFTSKDVYDLVRANSDSTTITRVELDQNKIRVVFSFGVQICTMIIEFEESYVGWKSLAKK